jgi:hypothetical protein
MAYYDHRNSVKDETNILQVVKAVKGETENNKYPSLAWLMKYFIITNLGKIQA